jgi:hypothetical protein
MKLKLTEEYDKIAVWMNYDNTRDFTLIEQSPTQQFNFNLENSFEYSPSMLLPPAIRYLSPDHKIIIFERPPQYVTYQLTALMQEEIMADQASGHVYRLPIPWQRYIVLLSADNMIANLFMFFASDEINNLHTDPLRLAPILNFYNNGRLCLASYVNQPEYEHSISGVIDRVYDMVWNSGFNFDTALALNSCLPHIRGLGKYKHDYAAMYTYWSSLSLNDVLRWSYPVAYESVLSFFNSGHLYHEYTGDAHDILLKIALAVQ